MKNLDPGAIDLERLRGALGVGEAGGATKRLGRAFAALEQDGPLPQAIRVDLLHAYWALVEADGLLCDAPESFAED